MSAARRFVDLVGRPVDAAIARLGGGVVALIYHRVGRRSPSPVDLPMQVFQDQLDDVAGRVVDFDTAVTSLVEGDGNGPASSTPQVVLTFDDGTADWPDAVLPALVERRLPAIFYVSTDFVERGRLFPDDGRPVSWSGLAEMASTGLATIASHTHTHRVLAGASAVEATDELDRSIGLIEDRLGRPCRHFAYPKAVAPSAAAEVVVRRRFATAALAGNRLNRPGADLHRLGRHALTVADDWASFRRALAGGRRLEGRLRELRDARRAGSIVT
jgi:peptidoglycan/xylan/chitin deacetylase (PgdA/CDA1 family)